MKKKLFIEEGIVEFKNNNLLILTSTSKFLKSLDKSLMDAIIKDSEEKMSKEEISDKEKYLLSHKIDTIKEINQ